MKIIEFLGESGAGKTFLFKKINNKYNEKNLFTYKIMFYFYLLETNKISYLKYIIIKFLIINEVGKSKNLLIKILSNFYFNIEENFKVEKKKIINKVKIKYKKFIFFYNFLLKKSINNKEQNILFKWLMDALIGHYLLTRKQYKGILLAPEGIYQRIFSLYQRSKISNQNLKKLIFLSPKVDQVFLIKKKNKKMIKIDKILRLIQKKRVNNSIIYNKKNFENNLKTIIKNFEIKNNEY
jgi:hypothetical protein